MIVDYAREMEAMKSCKYGNYRVFNHLFFLSSLYMYMCISSSVSVSVCPSVCLTACHSLSLSVSLSLSLSLSPYVDEGLSV